MSRFRAHNPAARWKWCETCKHRGYHGRSDARAVRKRHHGEKGLAVYSCPHTSGLFHVGHRPDRLSNGAIDRDELKLQAIQALESRVGLAHPPSLTAGERRGRHC